MIEKSITIRSMERFFGTLEYNDGISEPKDSILDRT